MDQAKFDLLISKVKRDIEYILGSNDAKYILNVLKTKKEEKKQYATWSKGLEQQYYNEAYRLYESAFDSVQVEK